MLDFTYEQNLITKCYTTIAGIDEVGRGPLAGPVVVAGVIFDKNHTPIPGINDSKKISPQKRITLNDQIITQAKKYAIGVGSIEMINEQGIMFALYEAINQVVEKLGANYYLMDGLPIKSTNIPINQYTNIEYIVKGDAKIYSIAAASIIAKIYRNNLMTKLAKQHPQYGWDRNMGYGTKEHREAIVKHGLTEHHRTGFCKNVLN